MAVGICIGEDDRGGLGSFVGFYENRMRDKPKAHQDEQTAYWFHLRWTSFQVGRAKGGMADTPLIVGVTLEFNKQYANKPRHLYYTQRIQKKHLERSNHAPPHSESSLVF